MAVAPFAHDHQVRRVATSVVPSSSILSNSPGSLNFVPTFPMMNFAPTWPIDEIRNEQVGMSRMRDTEVESHFTFCMYEV